MQQVMYVALYIYILFPFSLLAAAANPFASCFTVQPRKVPGTRCYSTITQDIGSESRPCLVIGFIESDNQEELCVKRDSVMNCLRRGGKIVDDGVAQCSTIVALRMYSSDHALDELRQLPLIIPPYIKNKIIPYVDLSTLDEQLNVLREAADGADRAHEAPLLQLDVERLNQYLQERYGITTRHVLRARGDNCIIS